MPELPEVETVRRGLDAHLVNKRVSEVILRRANLRVPLSANMAEGLKGKKLLRIERRAKYLLFHFEKGQVLLVHLGMSGRMLLVEESPASYGKHDHVVIRWADGHVLIFNDARRFGLMLLTDEKLLASHPLLAHLGPEPLGEALTGATLYGMLHDSKMPVKNFLMDQRRLVGVGNIYASEALFRAKVRPDRLACRVTKPEAGRLAIGIKQVLEAAIESGGSTLRDYVRSSGDAGYFQHHFNVYGRQKKPCLVCGTPIKILRQAGRSSFFCPHCQK